MNETATDSVRSGQTNDATMSDSVRRQFRSPSVRGAEHTITSAEALKLFIDNGLPRSSRSIERYCSSGKLDCFFDPDEQRYYASPASVELLIGHIKEIQRRHEQAVNVGQIPTAHTANVGQSPTLDAGMPHAGGDSVAGLNAKITRLETEASVNKLYIEKLHEERVKDIDKFIELANKIGSLETQLKQIEAPKKGRITEEQEGGNSNEPAEEPTRVWPVNES